MIYELWADSDEQLGLTFAPKNNFTGLLKQGLVGNMPKKIWEVKADSWEEACTKYHEYMGWEPYIPMKE